MDTSENMAHRAEVLNLIYELSQLPEETADQVQTEMKNAGRESEALNAVFKLSAIVRGGKRAKETTK